MTVESTGNKQAAQQMGTSLEYEFTLDVLLKDPTSDEAMQAIKAKVRKADGSEIDLTYGSDYTVILNSDRKGGKVVVTDMRTNADYITIYRGYELTQEADYQDFNALPAETLEQCFDKLTMLEQQQQEEIDRCVKVEMTSNINPAQLVTQIERIYASADNIDAAVANEANINAVVANAGNINTVSGSIGNVNAVGSNIAAVNNVSSNTININAVAEDLLFDDNIGTVASNIANVNAVAANESNINAVNANKTNIDAVKNNATNINTVAGIATDVTGVATISTAVTGVNSNATNINTVAGDKTNIDTVATNIASVVTASDNISTIGVIATDLNKGANSEIVKVNANKANIDLVGTNIDNVSAAGGNIANINAVVANEDNINAVAGDLTNINAVAADLTNIDNASVYAEQAQTSATHSQIYAEGTDEQVQALGGIHSAKNWSLLQGLVFMGEYNASTTYSKNHFVSEVSSTSTSFYISRVDNNIGHALTDTDYWFFMWTSTSGGTVPFPNVTGNPMDNDNLAAILNGKADVSAIPTKTSDLTNDSDFTTKTYVDNADGNLQTQIDTLSNNKQDKSQAVNNLATSGTISLTDNSINKITPSGTVTFSLPSGSTGNFHQILVQIDMSTVQTINAGTTYFFDSTAPDLSTAGTYNLLYEYDTSASHWVCGAIVKGTAS